MKKILFMAVALVAMTACTSTGKTDSSNTEATDSIASDSILEADAFNQAKDAARLDSIRQDSIKQDSIRQDSIAKVDANKFAKSIPDPKKLTDIGKIDKYLNSLGFTGTTAKLAGQKDFSEGSTGTYTLKDGDKTCTVTWDEGEYADSGCYGYAIKVTITGDDAALDTFYKNARKIKSSGQDESVSAEKSGNAVVIEGNFC